jgi:serine/threonine protein kinase/tetratricopeptide (TPR) repeat protein
MVEARWKRVSDIFHEALELPSGERDKFVSRAATGDACLELEVRELIEADRLAPDSYMPAIFAQDFEVQDHGHPSPCLPGEILATRFRVVRQVGEGGMGHVFEAYDLELAVTVALKVIHPQIANSREASARFLQEVRLARSITHPNVCRTFDIDRETRADTGSGEPRELVFLTMELLEGETLASRLKRTGPLPLGEALSVAAQVASALTAAHGLNIIHRDIKPSNIFLVQSGPGGSTPGRAVITDFGLARLAPGLPGREANSMASSRHLIGTLAYMAPEQMDGSPVSAATDIYAFGLVLFEMATGERAFPSDGLLNGIWQRISGEPVSGIAAPRLPAPWKHAIAGCLHRLPSERFQRAQEVMAVLYGGKIAQDSPGMRKPFSLLATPASHRWKVTVASGLTVVALIAGGLRLYETRERPEVASGALVYLAPVENRTGDKELDGLTELLRAGLSQSAQVNLFDEGHVVDIMQQMAKSPGSTIDTATAREIAMRAGAVRVIFATVSRSEGKDRLEVEMQQLDNNPSRYRNRWRKTFTWQTTPAEHASKAIPEDLLTQVRAASDWVRHEAGESEHDIARLDIPPGDVTTGDWEALMDFDQAERWLSKGHKDEAITLLRDAVQRDPGFARAYAELADNLVSMGKLSEGYEAYLRALNNYSGERLSRKERDHIKASFATDTRDYENAVEAFRDDTAFYENDFYAWAYQAYPLDKLDRPRDALSVLKHADGLTLNHGATGQMAYPYMLLGNHAAARQSITVARSAGRVDLALYLDGLEALCEEDYSKAGESFAQLKRMDRSYIVSLGYLGQIRLLAEQGRYEDALVSATSAISDLATTAGSEEKAKLWLDRSYIEFRLGHGHHALVDVAQSLDESTAPDTLLAASTIVGGALPTLTASERREARLVLGRMQSALPKEDLGVVFALARAQVRGELLLSEGDALGALAAFRAADKLDAPLAPREYLARGLLDAANRQSDSRQARVLRLEALKNYARVALRPATVWIDVWNMPPGFVADQMSAYLKLVRALRQANSDAASVAASLTALRKSATFASPQTSEAAIQPRMSQIH